MNEKSMFSGLHSTPQRSTKGPRETLERLAYRRCIPLTATVELTLRCNLRCVHCYNFDRSIPRASADPELSAQEMLTLIDDLAAEGCLYLSFSGGEALLHPRILQYIERARAHHCDVNLKTNGVLLTRGRVRDLLRRHVGGIDISLYGVSAETHDAFTLKEGSFELTVQGIRNAREAGFPVCIAYVLTRSNAGELPEFFEFAQSLGCSFNVDMQLTARYDGTRSSLEHRVDEETLQALYEGPLASLKPRVKTDSTGVESVQCACARSVVGVAANGDVYPCVGAPLVCGTVRKQRFGEIWRHSVQMRRIRGLALRDFKSCAPCSDRAYCQRSSGVAYTNTGDYTGPEPFLCMQAGVLRRLGEGSRSECVQPSKTRDEIFKKILSGRSVLRARPARLCCGVTARKRSD